MAQIMTMQPAIRFPDLVRTLSNPLPMPISHGSPPIGADRTRFSMSDKGQSDTGFREFPLFLSNYGIHIAVIFSIAARLPIVLPYHFIVSSTLAHSLIVLTSNFRIPSTIRSRTG
jgi:hypothetical protein